MSPRPSNAGARARTKLAEILVRAGYHQYKVLKAVSYPTCTGFSWEADPASEPFQGKPDDDFRLNYDIFAGPPRRLLQRPAGEGTFEGADRRRVQNAYDRARYVYNESADLWAKAKRLFVGESLLRVSTFDGWATGWGNIRWLCTWTYSDGTRATSTGGNNRRGTSPHPLPDPIGDYYTTGPHFRDYYRNGYAVVPPPSESGWFLPDFLTPDMPLQSTH